VRCGSPVAPGAGAGRWSARVSCWPRPLVGGAGVAQRCRPTVSHERAGGARQQRNSERDVSGGGTTVSMLLRVHADASVLPPVFQENSHATFSHSLDVSDALPTRCGGWKACATS
jgi:hypothetical protein